MLKKLQTIYALILLASMSLLPMEKEVINDDYAQAREFHERLQYANHGMLQDGVQSYYKKIDPIISIPADNNDNEWLFNSVRIAENYVRSDKNGFYTQGDISFTLDSVIDFDHTQSLDLVVNYRGEPNHIQFTNLGEKTTAVMPPFHSYNNLLDLMHNNELSLVHDVKLKGIVPIPGKKPCIILIKWANWRSRPLMLRGMEFVFFKNEKITKIFFDFTDQANKSMDYLYDIKYKNSIVTAYKKGICEFFDSLETRKKWVVDESNFYDLNNQILTRLPRSYTNDEGRGMTKEREVQVSDDVDDIGDLLYQVPDEIWELIFLAQNKYFTIEPEMLSERKAARLWCAMQNIVKNSLICKRFNTAAQKLLPSYTKEIKEYIDELGGRDRAAHQSFIHDGYGDTGDCWFIITKICKAMQADLNSTKYFQMGGNTFLTQAIKNKNNHQVRLLLQEGADPKKPNREGEMPIDLAYANDDLTAIHLIKNNGGDPDDKYEYKNGNFVCKQGQGGQAYDLNAANNNPPPVPPQTFFLASWFTKSPSYLFLAGISASAAAYWLYTKYRTTDEDEVEEEDYLEVDTEKKEDRQAAVSV